MTALKKPSLAILVISSILIIFGLFMLISAGAVASQEKFNQSLYFAKNQVLKGLIPGLTVGLCLFFLPYQYLRKFAPLIFFVCVILMALVFIPGIGTTLGGGRRWVYFGNFGFQPSEILKLSFVIYLAAFLSKKEKITQAKKLVYFLIIVGIVAFLIAMQPDIGTLGVFVLTAMAMYFVAQAPMSHLVFLSSLGFGALIIFIKIYPHALQRVRVFLNPEQDQKGIGYQMDQILIAFGAGGIFGQGLAQGKQKFFYLPQPATDSIAAIVGEELGFIGTFFLVSLFAAFFIFGFKIAKNAPDEFARLLALGITCLIFIQAFLNIGAVIGLIPLTGITLPFISYGGTSLAITIISTAILLNISRYAKTQH